MTMQPDDFKAARQAMGMTQGQLAEALGLTLQFIGMMERGVKPIELRTALAVQCLQAQARRRVPTGTGSAIDRATRSVIEETRCEAVSWVEGEPVAWSVDAGTVSEGYFRAIARAVVEAIREPGEQVIAAGAQSVKGIRPTSNHQALAAWQAMIDAALAD